MKLKTISQVATVAGLACAASAATAQTSPGTAQSAPEEVVVPLNDQPTATAPAASAGANQVPPGGYPPQISYDQHGGTYTTGYTGAYTPPARFPVERIPVQYLRYYPARWYGLPGSTLPAIAPQVHMPTDTTQLGYYYQRVPTWMPVPGMIPPPPNPMDYHTYRPVAYPPERNQNVRVISRETLDGQPLPGETGATTPAITDGETVDPNADPSAGGNGELPLEAPPAPAPGPVPAPAPPAAE